MRALFFQVILFYALTSPMRAESAVAWDSLKFHAAPQPLPAGAKSEDWPRFHGAQDAPVSGETGIRQDFPESGPPMVWECKKGSGYASPAVVEGKLILFHRVAGRETLDCLEAETGKRIWSYSYPVEYEDDFGYGDGPRAGPVVSGGKIYTFGVTSWLKCVDLVTGKMVWEVDCEKKYSVPKYFFGSGSSPLVSGDALLVNVGGGNEECVVAFDRLTGAEKWIVKHPWGQSYSSPILTKWHGTDRALFFTGGKSEPSTGGLVVMDPASGKLESTFPWRARRYPSVNAASPVLCGADLVFLTHAYVDRDHDQNGGVMLKTDAEGKLSVVWNDPAFGCHWMTPVYHDGHLYAFSGEKERQCDLVCYEASSGKRLWKEKFEWEFPASDGKKLPMSLYRASLLKVGPRFLCLGEWGTLCWLDLSPAGAKKESTAQLFVAEQTWTLPALSHGLLYVMQNEDDKITGKPARLICYDLRAMP